MQPRAHRSTALRQALAILAVLALALKLMVPAGYMPGSSWAAPIVLCPDQGAMPTATATHGHHMPSHAPHGGPDHPCAFAGVGAATLAAPFEPPFVAPVVEPRDDDVAAATASTPGRGLAAPPPPSHAPPLHA